MAEQTGPEVQIAPKRLGSFKLDEDLTSSEDDSGAPGLQGVLGS
jgi:hypothetical protein